MTTNNTSDQTTLALTAPQSRDLAIKKVERANRNWCALAANIICEASKLRAEFTADDIMPLLSCLPPPTDGRALGAAFLAAKRAGYIAPTMKFVSTKRASCHAAPIRVWASVHFKQEAVA